MSREKQVEEMAKDLGECHTIDEWAAREYGEAYTDFHASAEKMLDRGWIKQSEGEWITKHRHRGGFRTVTVVDSFGEKHTGMVDERWECDDLYCSVCGKISHDAFLNYCANCGARMSGGNNDE